MRYFIKRTFDDQEDKREFLSTLTKDRNLLMDIIPTQYTHQDTWYVADLLIAKAGAIDLAMKRLGLERQIICSMPMRGLGVSILRNAEIGDCSNKGLSSKHTSAILWAPHIDHGVIDINHEDPAPNTLIPHELGNAVHFDDLVKRREGKWLMNGGAMASTSDSRFGYNYGIKIHDRVE